MMLSERGPPIQFTRSMWRWWWWRWQRDALLISAGTDGGGDGLSSQPIYEDEEGVKLKWLPFTPVRWRSKPIHDTLHNASCWWLAHGWLKLIKIVQLIDVEFYVDQMHGLRVYLRSVTNTRLLCMWDWESAATLEHVKIDGKHAVLVNWRIEASATPHQRRRPRPYNDLSVRQCSVALEHSQ